MRDCGGAEILAVLCENSNDERCGNANLIALLTVIQIKEKHKRNLMVTWNSR